MDKVSVIIPTYNRFKYVFNTIKSVKEQTYPNIEIIVVNDCSTEKEYYEYDWKGYGVTILHLEKNSREVLGHASCGYVRNKGIEVSSGKYIGFCDDDDIWFPEKIEKQVKAMKETGCKMSSTDGLFGAGVYDPAKTYKKYNAEHYYDTLQTIFIRKRSPLLLSGFPRIWNLDFLKVHNCVIVSSVLMERELLDTLNNMNALPIGQEDYDCWLRALEHTNNVYIDDVCFYYDGGHGDGQVH